MLLSCTWCQGPISFLERLPYLSFLHECPDHVLEGANNRLQPAVWGLIHPIEVQTSQAAAVVANNDAIWGAGHSMCVNMAAAGVTCYS